MIVKTIGNTQIYICEDTAQCIVKDIVEEIDVIPIAEFLGSMNYVVSYISGSNKAAKDLQYYTAGKIVEKNKIDFFVEELT